MIHYSMGAVPLFPGMAVGSVVGQLDALFIALTVLSLAHAVSKRGLWAGLAVVTYLTVHTAAFEHVSLFLGGTHCHASSDILPMVTPCSSVNSVLFYVPWTYTSIEAARRLNLSPFAFPFAVGLLQFGFGAVYEMQGPWNVFWQWPDEAGLIASSPVLQPWDGYPPLAALATAKAHREVATIASGVFRVSQHAGGALAERLFMFPILAPYFHFAFGFGWAAGLLCTGEVSAATAPSLPRLVIAGMLSVLLFLPPIWITRGVSEAIGLPLTLGVPISLAISFLPLALIGRRVAAPPRGQQNSDGSPPAAADPLLFVISLGMHAFMVSYPWRATKPEPPGLVALVTATATMHLAAQGFCCFMVHQAGGTGRKGQKRQ